MGDRLEPVPRLIRRALPVALLAAVYWPGVTGWFFQDDFGWLNLRHDIHTAGDLGRALVAPKAHGNMRPLGENAYWLGLAWVFGPEALPFHGAAFVTMAAGVLLLGAVVRRLAGSEAGALAAQAVWMANIGVAPVLGWSSIYNQALSAFLFLLAFYFLLRGKWAAQWIAFVLGLGALEINVVYPVVAAVYALLFDRRLLRKILPMFAVSALAVWVHFYFAPPPTAGVYAPRVDWRIFETVWTYWKWVLGQMPVWPALALTAAVAGLAGKAPRDTLMGLAWFAIPLAPYLPLAEHRMDYYLAVPAIGIAMLAGVAVARWRIPAAVCLLLYLGASVPAAWTVTRWQHARGERVETLVRGVQEIHERAPRRIILLECIDTDLFFSGVADLPFRALEIPRVYLAPGSEMRIQAAPDLLSKYVLPAAIARPAIGAGNAAVYCFTGAGLRRASGETLPLEDEPRFVNLGDDVFAAYFGLGWTREPDGLRSMSGSAMVRIGGPRRPGEALYIGVFETRDMSLSVRANGVALPVERVSRGNDLTEFRAALPAASGGWREMEVWIGSSGPRVRFGYLEVR